MKLVFIELKIILIFFTFHSELFVKIFQVVDVNRWSRTAVRKNQIVRDVC